MASWPVHLEGLLAATQNESLFPTRRASRLFPEARPGELHLRRARVRNFGRANLDFNWYCRVG